MHELNSVRSGKLKMQSTKVGNSMEIEKIISLRMERQHILEKADEQEYISLYRDLQPGVNVYWNGFGQPPVLSYRASFDDMEFNRIRQRERKLVKGRFAGGNLGWIEPEEMELFLGLYNKPLDRPTFVQTKILELIETAGPFTIQQIKEETGFLVKEITPVLHRLQEAFLIYEDQYDGEWDRGWYKFSEMFPNIDREKFTRVEALKIVLKRFAYRLVWFDVKMAKSFYKLPERDIIAAISEMVADGIFESTNQGYVLVDDVARLAHYTPVKMHFICALHRNDILYKVYESQQKERMAELTKDLEYDHEPLQYLLIDGEFHGACVGHFRNGPYDLNDIICDLPDAEKRKEEIITEIQNVNYGKMPLRFMGKEIH